MLKKMFIVSWWVGFLMAVGFMVWLYVHIDVEHYIETFNDNYKNLFLILGLVHMSILVVLGFWVILRREEHHIEVANRVSTMGYLHTLIGTSIALIQMASMSGNISTNLKSILIPIGSALLTSIIGWAFAKEMESDRYRYKSSKQDEVEDSLEFLADKIRTVGINLEATSVGWEKSIEHTVNKLIASADRLENNIGKVEDRFTKSIELVEEGLTQSSKYSEEFLSKLHDAFMKTFSLMENVSSEWNKHLISLEKFSAQSDESLEELFKNSKKIAEEVTLVAETLPSASNIIKEVDALIALLRERDEGGL